MILYDILCYTIEDYKLKREFVETAIFSKLIDQIGDKALKRAVENLILQNPEKGDLIKGSGGVRKIRVPKQNKGKSGGYRVIYFDLSEFMVTYLILIYDKSDLENISQDQLRHIKVLVEDIKSAHKKKNTGYKR